MKGCAPGLALKVRLRATSKWLEIRESMYALVN